MGVRGVRIAVGERALLAWPAAARCGGWRDAAAADTILRVSSRLGRVAAVHGPQAGAEERIVSQIAGGGEPSRRAWRASADRFPAASR